MESKTKNIQDAFLKRVKSAIPSNLSFVDELAELLGVSNDSAYRRLRGDTPLTIDEISLICSHFKIPFETDSQPGSESVTFSYFPLEGKREKFKRWLETLLRDVTGISSVSDHHIIYAADDVPIWHHFINEEFTCFKIFYWLKCIINDSEYADKTFDPDFVDKDLVNAAKQLLQAYNKTNSTEIWTEDTVNSTLKQIEYFWESGYFRDKEQALKICADVEEILNVLQKKAEKNSKLINKDEKQVENFKLYRSEVMIGNNSILVTRGTNKIAYASFNTFNFLTTTNSAFVIENEEWLKNLMRKSILISGVSEKQRNQFFKQLRDKVELLKQSIK